jgi:hypothetical protein
MWQQNLFSIQHDKNCVQEHGNLFFIPHPTYFCKSPNRGHTWQLFWGESVPDGLSRGESTEYPRYSAFQLVSIILISRGSPHVTICNLVHNNYYWLLISLWLLV